MSQTVDDYPNVYQKIHNTSTIERVRDLVMQDTSHIYQYKVKDEGYKLCAYQYVQVSDRYDQTIPERKFYPNK